MLPQSEWRFKLRMQDVADRCIISYMVILNFSGLLEEEEAGAYS